VVTLSRRLDAPRCSPVRSGSRERDRGLLGPSWRRRAQEPLQRLGAAAAGVEGGSGLVAADLRRQRYPNARLHIRQVGDDKIDRLR
jgi:hypothetical protein